MARDAAAMWGVYHHVEPLFLATSLIALPIFWTKLPFNVIPEQKINKLGRRIAGLPFSPKTQVEAIFFFFS